MKRMCYSWKSLRGPLWCTLACGTLLAGCVPAPTQPNLRSYDVPSDRCNSYRQPLIATSNDLDQWDFIGKSILAGAVIGGIGGRLIGGDTKSAAIGAAFGTAAGAVAGHHQYLQARQQQARSRQELIDGINGDSYADSARVREITDSIRKLGACRRDQVDEIKDKLKRGVIRMDQALTRVDEVKAASAQDRSLMEEVLGKADKRYEVYVDSKAEVLGVDRTRVAAAQPTAQEIAAIKAKDLKPMSGTYRIKSGANIRQGPSTATKKITYFPAGRKLDVNGATRDGKWYAFDHQGKTAFVYASLLTPDKADDPIVDLSQSRRIARNAMEEESLALDSAIEGIETAIGG
jgi:hypothetical protein